MGPCVSKNTTKGDTTEQEVGLVGGNVELIVTKEEWDGKLAEAKRDGRIVIANFSAVWCSPCENIVPFYSSLSVKYPYMMFLTVDVDELSDFSSSMDIKATPTFLIYKEGELIHKLVGANKIQLQRKIDSLAAASSPLRSL
ncbi:unnamed protein product [Rhodiola kirilowii]